MREVIWRAGDFDDDGDHGGGGGGRGGRDGVIWRADDFEDEVGERQGPWDERQDADGAGASFTRANSTAVRHDCSSTSLASQVSEDDFFQGLE
jgi:hypothetical protein